MLVTQNGAELCALLIDEIYGELPSRIFAVLLNRGRSSLPQLVQYTSMSPRQLRHGLAVLNQHSLLYFDVNSDNGMTVYEPNTDNAYNLARIGKVLEMVDTSLSPSAKDVMQSLLLSGQTRISDLVAAYQSKIDHASNVAKLVKDEGDDWPELNGTNGDVQVVKMPDTSINSAGQLNSVLCRLVEAELVEVIHKKTFLSPQDILRDVEKETLDKYFLAGVKGGKGKIEFQEKVADGLRKVRDESKSLKRKLEQNGTAAKRRKLFSGVGMSNGNGTHEEESGDPGLDPKQVIRINWEKCLVELRNRRLYQFVADMIGENTAYVYAVLLKLLTKRLARCRLDPTIDIKEGEEDIGVGFVTTDEILDNLKTGIDLSLGLGKATKDKISSKAAEVIHEHPPKKKLFIAEAEVDGDASADEEDEEGSGSESGESDAEYEVRGRSSAPVGNGTKVKFADAAAGKEQRLDRPGQLRQHLLLLAESTQHFVRHCGPDEWTVDFVPLMHTLCEAELDSVIEQRSGKPGLRLVRLLRDKGKLDEKSLQNVALMRKAEVQQKMLEMQTAGFVHIQEVPRDNKADVKKSFFLWFCDIEKSATHLVDTSYRTMVRCLQILEVIRQQEKDVLMLTKRTDVKGREKDVMRKEYYDRYSRFRENEKKLFAQVMRLDDFVSLLRDF
ncbi:RNA polymerase III subunit RPC82-domain-containing protein [Lasiosphaeria hispida]|uniref:DNA-directed RNA polymerase III subunit RPC3 n=1 Tax=Lasiosphaeria hispida TaxID=260671 RepID=A0AAJ0H9R8_9PEZI|nr:RNA polymerase III subunit RPC82-domain-containing protein [Lasiosphaeria hispida]